MLFCLPLINNELEFNWILKDNRGPHHQLTRIISTLPEEKSLVCFSAFTTQGCFPLVYNTNSRYASSFPFYWWFRSLQYYEAHYKVLPPKIMHDKKYILNKIIRDFEHYQPNIIISINGSPTGELIDYLKKNPDFYAVWKNYHYFKSIDYYHIYVKNR
jgi:hypothetical protein